MEASCGKGLEAWFTVLIEALWPKRRILETYLNIAQFGDGAYGAEAAACRFYHKPAARLTSSEAAVPAAVLPNPIKMRADKPSAYVTSRRDWILNQMRDPGRRKLPEGHREREHTTCPETPRQPLNATRHTPGVNSP